MAPGALKRPAAAAQSAAKKGKVTSAAAPYSDIVVTFRADGTSRDMMLAGCVESSLAVYKSERHGYQNTVVEMIGAALEEKATTMQAKVDAGKGMVDGAGAEKLNRQKALTDAEDSLNAVQAAVAVKKAGLTNASAELTKVTTAREELEVAQRGARNAYLKLVKSREHVESFMTLFAANKDQQNNNKATKSLVKAAKELGGVEPTMLSSFSAAIAKEPASRGEFDKFVLGQFDATLAKIATERIAAVEAEASNEAERGSVLDAARATELAALEMKNGMVVAISDAKMALKNRTAEVLRAKKAVCNYIFDMKAVMDGYDDSIAQLSAFRAGPLTTFVELRDREAPLLNLVHPSPLGMEPEAVDPVATPLDVAPPDAAASKDVAPEAAVPEAAASEAAAPEAAAVEAASLQATSETVAPSAPM